jgi:hypothetical protein
VPESRLVPLDRTDHLGLLGLLGRWLALVDERQPAGLGQGMAGRGEDTAAMIALTSVMAIRSGAGWPTGRRTSGVLRSTCSAVQSSSVRLGRSRYSPNVRDIPGRICTAGVSSIALPAGRVAGLRDVSSPTPAACRLDHSRPRSIPHTVRSVKSSGTR